MVQRGKCGYVIMVVVILLSSMGINPYITYASTTSVISGSNKDVLKNSIVTYANNLTSNNQLNQESTNKITNLMNVAIHNIDESSSDATTLETYITSIKIQMDEIASGKLSDISEYLVLTDNVATPTATHGKSVNVILSILNLSDTPLSDLIITPIVDASANVWPFELSSMGYTKVIADISGSDTYEDALTKRQEIMYTFQTRDDVLSGYYKVEFHVKYTRGTVTESTTLSTYVKAVGAPGSGSLEGSGSDGQMSKPRIIVNGFRTTPEEVYAGDVFTIDLFVENTSSRTAVSNMQIDLKATPEGSGDTQYEAFLPTSGSNTVYVSAISASGTATVSIEMTAKADLAQKPYVLNVSMEYEDAQYNSYTSEASVSIPIKQESKFDMSTPEVMPSNITVGAQSNVMYSIYNTGKTTLYNVQAKFESDSIMGGDVFIGQIEPGATGNVDAMITGVAATMDDGMITAVISYEDEAGNQTIYEEKISLYVMEQFVDPMPGEWDDMYDPMMPEEDGMSTGVIVVIVVIVAAAGVVGFLKVRKIRKAKKELELELEDLEDDDTL